MAAGSISEFYRDQTVFITGGTGFLGKVLVEKLLRLNQIKKIYLLVRPKKGKSVDERMDELFAFQCFDRLKKINVDFKTKVEFLHGDCEERNLGLNAESEQVLIKETNVFIHAAANVKFDQPLRVAGNINVRGTRDAVRLAKQMTGLKAFVYVSTAYSNCPNSDIKEEFYKPPMTAHQLLSILNEIDDEMLDKISPELIGKWPNCYTYTKSIAEDVIKTEGKLLPAAIVRPPIVMPTIEEPMPGWIDNLYGAVGISVAAALGVLRTMHIKKDATTHFIPCDYAVNAILATAWDVADKKCDEAKIYNCVNSTKNLITWGKYLELGEASLEDYQTSKIIWHFTFKSVENKLWYNICIFFLHTCMAHFVDLVLFCIGREPIAVKNYSRIDNMLDLTSYFTTNSWNFRYDNIENLWQGMGDDDKKTFKFDMERIDWASYVRDSVIGERIYLLKDPLETIPQAKKKVKIFRIAHYTFLGVFWCLLYFLFKMLYTLVF